MECDSFRDDMLEVLYGEAEADVARRFAEHERTCAGCRAEIRDLRRLRGELAAWTPPAALRPARTVAWRPAMAGLAAAAGLVMALGGAFAVDRARDDTRARLTAQEERHREEMRELRAALASRAAPDEQEILRKVAAMIRDSESRQATAREAGLTEVRQETEARRRYDLARMSTGLAYVDSKAGLQTARTNELLGQVLQASQQR